AADLQGLLNRFVAAEELDGGVLLVSGPGGRQVVTAGIADRRSKRPVTPDSRFYIASIGKMAVAVAVMQMVEEGRLSLDQPVRPLLEGLPDIDRLANVKSARLAHLLNHTSGIPDYLDEDFSNASAAAPRRVWTPATLMPFAYGLPATNKPGKRHEYSNSNYVLLGHLLEGLEGADLGRVLTRRVFERAGMTATTVGADPRDSTLAHGYAEGKDSSLTSWLATTGDGPLVSTAGDLERFILALFRDHRLLGAETVRRMQAPADAQGEYGLGMELWDDDWGKAFGHTGRYDGFEAEARYYPEHGTALLYITNGNQSSEESLLDKVAAAVFNKPAKSGTDQVRDRARHRLPTQ
ncbi:MAG: beta-lactamase family protein, partial [Rhodospirillales bacterium]|nr:beta-lactamase family protein [Rhodospirillales bacterium]